MIVDRDMISNPAVWGAGELPASSPQVKVGG
jgi:hypothetical protein